MRHKDPQPVLDELSQALDQGRPANLRGWNLSTMDLPNINLAGMDLRRTKFIGAELRGVILRGADLTGADLQGALLYGADLNSANLTGANLRGANLRASDLTQANLTGANLAGARLVGATLDPRQLLGSRGLSPNHGDHRIPPAHWDRILPKDPVEKALLFALLDDWGGTLQEAIDAATALRDA